MQTDSYQPLERRKVYEQVAEQLLGQIGSGRLTPGRPASARARADRELRRRPLVDPRGAADARVAGRDRRRRTAASFVVADAANPLNSSLRLLFTLDDRAGLHDLFELRRILECEAAALAAERHGPTSTSTRWTRRSRRWTTSLGDSGLRDRLHRRRPPLPPRGRRGDRQPARPAQHAGRARRRSARADDRLPDPAAAPRARVVEHRPIRAAIAAGDADARAQEMRDHLVRVETDVEKGVSQWLSSASSASA